MNEQFISNFIPVIVAFIGFLGVLSGAIFGYLGRSKKQAVIDAKKEQKSNDNWDRVFSDIEGIKKRLDDHNHYGEKFAKNSEELTKVNLKLEQVQKDIEYLKSSRCKV